MKRRQLLHLTGVGFIVALSGCSGNGSGGSESTETETPNTQTLTATPTADSTETSTEKSTATETESQKGLPEGEDGDLESKGEANVAERGDFGIKVGNYNAVTIPEYPDIELGRNDEGEFYTLEEALYLAMNTPDNGRPSETVYIMGKNLASESFLSNGGMQMYTNGFEEDGSGVRLAAQIEEVVYGDLGEGEVSEEQHKEAFSSFFGEHIDMDAVVDHCGDVPDYVTSSL